MVMPRSRSMSMLSSTWLVISRSVSPPHAWISRSASVDLPWSMCAMIEKLRMRASGVSVMEAPAVPQVRRGAGKTAGALPPTPSGKARLPDPSARGGVPWTRIGASGAGADAARRAGPRGGAPGPGEGAGGRRLPRAGSGGEPRRWRPPAGGRPRPVVP